MIIKSGTLFTNLEKKEEKDIEDGKTEARSKATQQKASRLPTKRPLLYT
jgi:hypothetical protein